MDHWMEPPEGRWNKTKWGMGLVLDVVCGLVLPPAYVLGEPLLALINPWAVRTIVIGQVLVWASWRALGPWFPQWSRQWGYGLVIGTILAAAMSVWAAPAGFIWLIQSMDWSDPQGMARAILEMTPVGLAVLLGINAWKAFDEGL